MTDPQFDWSAVAAFVRPRVLVVPPIAGTAEWCRLADGHPAKLAAVLVAGSRWVLEQEFDQIDAARLAEKDAAVEVSRGLDWARVAKRLRDRDQFYRDHPDLRRKPA